MAKEWFSIRNTVTTIIHLVVKLQKQLVGAISLLNMTR